MTRFLRPPVARDSGQQAEEHVRKGSHGEDEPGQSRPAAAVEDDPRKRDEGEANGEVVAELRPHEEAAVSRAEQRVGHLEGHLPGAYASLATFMIRFLTLTMREQS